MEVKHLSTTLLQNWPICPARAWNGYTIRNEHGDDVEGTEPTRFGTVVHNVAEEYHQIYMQGLELPDPVELFDRHWQENKAYDFDYYQLGRDRIGTFLERTLHARRGDTIMVELDFVLDLVTLEVYVVSDYQNRQSLVDSILRRGGVPVASKIDRVDRVDETTFEIYDYKTNALPFTRHYVDNSLQLQVYDMAVRALYPEANEVICVFDMVRHGRFPTDFSSEQRETTRQYLINLWHQIKAESKPEERINEYCTWCEIKNTCSAYAKVLEEDPEVGAIESGTPEDMEFLYDRYTEFGARIKILDAERDKIKELLGGKIVNDNFGEAIQVSKDKEIYLQQNPRYEYPMSGVYGVLQKRRSLALLKDIAIVSKTSLDRVLKTRPELREELDPLLRTSFAKPTLRARRPKPNGKQEELNEAVHGNEAEAGDV